MRACEAERAGGQCGRPAVVTDLVKLPDLPAPESVAHCQDCSERARAAGVLLKRPTTSPRRALAAVGRPDDGLRVGKPKKKARAGAKAPKVVKAKPPKKKKAKTRATGRAAYGRPWRELALDRVTTYPWADATQVALALDMPVASPALRSALAGLVTSGELQAIGKGLAGDPTRYALAGTDPPIGHTPQKCAAPDLDRWRCPSVCPENLHYAGQVCTLTEPHDLVGCHEYVPPEEVPWGSVMGSHWDTRPDGNDWSEEWRNAPHPLDRRCKGTGELRHGVIPPHYPRPAPTKRCPCPGCEDCRVDEIERDPVDAGESSPPRVADPVVAHLVELEKVDDLAQGPPDLPVAEQPSTLAPGEVLHPAELTRDDALILLEELGGALTRIGERMRRSRE